MIDAFVLQNNNDAHKTKENTTMNNSGSKPSIVYAKEIQQELGDGSRRGDLSYVANKRKVPRGPDPIHNRRAGNSRRPPGRA
ncbi:unnamed protein product [Arabis nemorensis]|uniref:CLAVATA3/ESR-like protein n=1 Tax=Arabis nemorensis TaxID=586526 RepID=A0A565AZ77_9BRAS|nr:unnamed protein product [Arabis nemorensis]